MSRAGLDPHWSFPTQDILGYRPIPYTITIVAKTGVLLPRRFNITTLSDPVAKVPVERTTWDLGTHCSADKKYLGIPLPGTGIIRSKV